MWGLTAIEQSRLAHQTARAAGFASIRETDRFGCGGLGGPPVRPSDHCRQGRHRNGAHHECRLVVRHSWGIAQHSHAWRSGRDQDEAVAAADRGVGISDPRDHRDRPVGPQGRGRPPFSLGGVVRA